MRLHSAAKHFNRMPCNDAYTGAFLFNGQISLYDETKRDAESSERRIIELAPEISLPARLVVEAHGIRYIMAHGFDDSALGAVIRRKYVAHEATHLATWRTLQQVCENAVGTQAWAAKAWVKDSKEIDESSDMVGVNHIHMAVTEATAVTNIVHFDGVYHIVRKTTKGPAGTLILTCDEVPEPAVETGSLKTGTYDPINETMATTTTSVRVLRLRWQSLFEYRDALAGPFRPEDMQAVIAKSAATPAVGAMLTLSDGEYQINSVMSETGVWVCKVARHG
jgi:hypothetical protein